MQVQHLYQPFEIRLRRSDECPLVTHKHTFFELVYIISGEGVHHIDGNGFPYLPDNLFLLMPGDSHYFTITNTTTFLLIRFSNIYLEAQKAADRHSTLGDWITKLEYVFQNNNRPQGCLIRNAPDKPLVRALVAAIAEEEARQQPMQKELVQQLVNTLITVVARNISPYTGSSVRMQGGNPADLLHYIHLHIYQPDKLRSEAIATHFSISLNYISEYFKKMTGSTLQQYIIRYKLSLAETRLAYSDMRLNEIAWELGFTDESHLAKTFRKYKGVTPAAYRRTVTAGLAGPL